MPIIDADFIQSPLGKLLLFLVSLATIAQITLIVSLLVMWCKKDERTGKGWKISRTVVIVSAILVLIKILFSCFTYSNSYLEEGLVNAVFFLMYSASVTPFLLIISLIIMWCNRKNKTGRAWKIFKLLSILLAIVVVLGIISFSFIIYKIT